MSISAIIKNNLYTSRSYTDAISNIKSLVSSCHSDTYISKLVAHKINDVIIDTFLMNYEYRVKVYECIKKLSSSRSRVSNIEIAETVVDILNKVDKDSDLGQCISKLLKEIDIILQHDSSFEELIEIMCKVNSKNTDRSVELLLVLYYTLIHDAPNTGRVGRKFTMIRTRMRETYQRKIEQAKYSINLEKTGQFITGRKNILDIFSTKLPGGLKINGSNLVPTNTYDRTESNIRPILFNAGSETQDDLMRFIKEGEVLVGVNHEPWNSSTIPNTEEVKLQCGHSNLVMRVDDRIVTIDNPRGYNSPAFGNNRKNYTMVFIKPILPLMLSEKIKKQFWRNITTWAIIANQMSTFEGDYNEGGALGANNIDHLKELGNRLIGAFLGNNNDIAWLTEKKNQLYCAELVYVSLSLGLYYPLNRATLSDKYEAVKEKIAKKDWRGIEKPPIKDINLNMADENLKSISYYMAYNVEDSENTVLSERMAVTPFSAIDMIDQFIQMKVQRVKIGEEKACMIQKKLAEGLENFIEKQSGQYWEFIKPKYTEYCTACGKKYEDYFHFRSEIEKPLEKLRGLLSNNGKKLYVSPSVYMIRATQQMWGETTTGILDWQYIGHGVTKEWV